MNADFELVVFDTVALDELETVNVGVKLVYATYAPPPGSAAAAAAAAAAAGTASGGAGGGAGATPGGGPAGGGSAAAPTAAISFQNSFRSCDDKLYLLGVAELQVARYG